MRSTHIQCENKSFSSRTVPSGRQDNHSTSFAIFSRNQEYHCRGVGLFSFFMDGETRIFDTAGAGASSTAFTFNPCLYSVSKREIRDRSERVGIDRDSGEADRSGGDVFGGSPEFTARKTAPSDTGRRSFR